ncbi:hypothetical protein FRB93_001704 [Tulasnella sp. JGI-2019a]|nr:hypothetical protein FRB93_001704 [Tulasnella sp. JGI-2019a]
MAVLGIVIVHTSYITLFIVGRLWSVGSAANRFVSPQEVKKNRYQEAINALIQSGAIYLVTMLLCICALASERVIFIAAVRGVAADANSISSILLFLQLDLFQERTQHAHVHEPPLTTGATVEFANQETTSMGERGWSRVSAARLRRTSMPAYLHHDIDEGVTYLPTSAPILVTLAQRKAGGQSLSDSSAATSRLDDGSLPDKKEPTTA